MATAIQRRRGNTAQHASFTGLAGEITIDTDKNTVVVHDGTTAGGHALAKASEVQALGGADITAVIAGSGLSGGASSGNATISLNYENLAGNLVPSANNTYSLGSVNKVWKDVYVGPGSLYVNGQKVLEDNNGTIVVSADSGQNLSLVTSGGGDLELSAGATGDIQIKSNIVVSAGKTITASGGLKLASNIDANSQYINNLTNPVQQQDAATKQYVDLASYLSASDGVQKSNASFSVDNTVVRTSGTQTIGGAKTFSADLVVSGNLTVSGTTTTVNSETISLADNIIDLNSNFTTGSPTENAGLRIKRGDSADVQVRWNEADDKWQFTNDGSTYADILTATQVKALFSATDAGGDGSFSYSDGVFTYTGPSQAEANTRIDARLSGGTGVSYTSGVIAIGQAVGTTSNVTFNTVTANLVGNVTGNVTGDVSGNITGDVSGNAGTATKLATARTIALSGDVVGSATFDGSANATITATISANSVALGSDTTGDYVSAIAAGTGLSSTGATSGEGISHTLSLASSGVTLGTYGSASAVPSVVVDTYGRITSASNVTISVTSGQVSDFTTAARANISVTDSGGDGSLSYNSTSGVITYTGPSQSEANTRIDARLSGSDGVSYSSGVISLASSTAGAGLTYSSGVLSIATSAAGAGLTLTSGVLAVGAGTGISVAADAVGLANSGVTAGVYGSSTEVAQITVDAYGRITSASNVTIAGDITAVTAGSYLTGGGSTGAVTLNVDATTTATANKVAARDASGDLYANIFQGTASSARYADLAERYEADAILEPGTVVCFGGEKEITACDHENDHAVAGVVSTDPAYMMNSAAGNNDTHPYIALTGRVPVKVVGPVAKGDLLVASGVKGHAMANNNAKAGTIIGKAIGSSDSGEGVVEALINLM